MNDAVCLLATPVVLGAAKKSEGSVVPFLFAVAMGSNAGSALTLAGNPQNMLVAKLSQVSSAEYLATMGLPALMALVATAATLHFLFRKSLRDSPQVNASSDVSVDPRLMSVALACLAGAVLANMAGVSLALSALLAGSITLLMAGLRAEKLLARVDWGVMLFFAGLFVLVRSLEKTGFPTQSVSFANQFFRKSVLSLSGLLMVGSQIVSNVPLILLLEPWIASFENAQRAWCMTALVSTLAGDLTLLGSVANIIVLEQSIERIGFWAYLKVGLPVTCVSAGAAALTLWFM